MAKHKGDHGHHGGAWKVAYADFVTAMMALFIVLWILGSSQETQAAVASYFRHPSILKSGGTGFLTEEGMREYEEAVERIRLASQADSTRAEGVAEEEAGSGGTSGTGEGGSLSESARALEVLLDSSARLRELNELVSMTITDEGLRIQIADIENAPLFELGSTRPTGSAREILSTIAAVLAPLSNQILLEGHTDNRPFAGRGDYTNWELSGDRANAARRILEESGIPPERIASVVGYADRRPIFPDDPGNPRNRRISIIVREETPRR